MEQNENLNSQTLIADFCSRFDIRPAALPHTPAGKFEVVNPDQKDLSELIGKIWRKMSEEKIDHSYIEGHEAETFNLIRDYARCGVLVNNFAEAPALIRTVMNHLGGEVSVHNRDTYKAIHLHTQLGGINCEVQFHTFETYALKRATDASYQKWRKAKAENKEAVLENPEYIEENKVMRPLCKAIYDRSGFEETLPEIEKLQAANQPVPQMQLKSIVNVYRRAAQVQDQLLTTVKGELEQVSTQSTKPQLNTVLSKEELDALLNAIAEIHSDDQATTQVTDNDLTQDFPEPTNEKA